VSHNSRWKSDEKKKGCRCLPFFLPLLQDNKSVEIIAAVVIFSHFLHLVRISHNKNKNKNKSNNDNNDDDNKNNNDSNNDDSNKQQQR